MIFIAAAAVMILIAAACIGIPLWRARARLSLATDAANRAVHAARVEELERDVAAGRLAAEDFAGARRDLDRELEASLRAARQVREQAFQTPGQRVTAIAVAALLIIAAGVLYWQLGNWRAGVEGVQQASVVSVEQMVAQLSQRLATTDKNDLQGWEVLGHAYLLMGRYGDAENAYQQARRLSGDENAAILAGYGQAVALADPDEFMRKAMPAFEKALHLDPSNPQALWYGGLGALESGNKRVAVARWNALLAQDPPAEYRSIIEKAIVAAGGAVTPAGQSGSVAQSASGIHVRVTLDARLRNRVSPDETLFVFAEAAGQRGGPPLAVRRFQVRDLPIEVTLTNSDAVIAGRDLASVARATIVARIASRGTATPQPGDLVGQAGWQSGRNGSINILIDKILP
ncbi:MAG TPA: c-type cytochrome biogenesis protein CcmI [Gammaproteobacteria bacterium]|nr:c-type cytochrome biogenesis protein CcmI [Gammaproteobacteria bacterium]